MIQYPVGKHTIAAGLLIVHCLWFLLFFSGMKFSQNPNRFEKPFKESNGNDTWYKFLRIWKSIVFLGWCICEYNKIHMRSYLIQLKSFKTKTTESEPTQHQLSNNEKKREWIYSIEYVFMCMQTLCSSIHSSIPDKWRINNGKLNETKIRYWKADWMLFYLSPFPPIPVLFQGAKECLHSRLIHIIQIHTYSMSKRRERTAQ